MKTTRILITGFAILVCWSGSLLADYTIVLKNNRRITVKNYWEESGMVKFHALGGKIGIGKRQIYSIVPASEARGQGIIVGEKLHSDLRNQLNVLHDERKRLIQDMERIDQFTGSLSFEQ